MGVGMSLFSILTHFNEEFSRIPDEKPEIQYAINSEHNARNIGTGSIDHKIVDTHDEIMRQALAPRQL